MKKRTLTYIILSVILTTQLSSAFAMDNNSPNSPQIFSQFFKNHPHWATTPINARLRIASAQFLNQPYELGSLGEGPTGEFDQHPLYRADAFDCETFVTTVLALSNSHSFTEFTLKMNQIRYQNAEIDYVHRNHFTTTDYNLNAMHLGLIQDFSYRMLSPSGEPIAQVAQTIFNKPGWYKQKKLTDLSLQTPISAEEKAARLEALHSLAQRVHAEKAVQTYIPLTALFDEKGNPIKVVWDQIPEVALIEIVRPQWHLADKIGTDLLVSHMGFALRSNGHYQFREASQTLGKVVDVSLEEYLKNYRDHPTIKGISIFTIQS